MRNHVRIAHFSAGASSAVAAIIGNADVLLYADTRSEHADNARFAADIAAYMERPLIKVGSEKYSDTWDVWEQTGFIANRFGAPCTKQLKMLPLAPYEALPHAVHIFGYNAGEQHRLTRLKTRKPALQVECPLIEAGITAAGALGYLERIGVEPPETYSLGMPHANCIPCPKASSPAYWAAIRKYFPEQFARMSDLEEKLNAGQGRARVKGKRVRLKDLPIQIEPKLADTPSCDLLCEAAL